MMSLFGETIRKSVWIGEEGNKRSPKKKRRKRESREKIYVFMSNYNFEVL